MEFYQWSVFSLEFGYSWWAASFCSRPIFFLIYINDLPLGLTTDVKLFADDNSLFSLVSNANVSASSLNIDLVKIRDWAFSWKMLFKPDPTKQVKEVRVFFFKKSNSLHSIVLTF